MIFSVALQQSVHRQFLSTQSALGLCRDEILTRLSGCKEDERTAMEFFYSTMPASDIGDYDFSLYQKFAGFGRFIANNCAWYKQIPESIFLNFVLYYRVNNEAIEYSREFFYNALKDRINGKDMKEAALEVNLWCAEHVTYQSTDDRTVSPLTAFKASYGRCGEESTFVVTAMRSVGIPARQIYTPRWAHCDDNHAWVEVWCDGEWYYLGACEPEPVLNRGWFTEAAARAMLVHSKSFYPVEGEEVISKNGQEIILNELSRYAAVTKLTVKILNSSKPVAGAAVYFELLNGAEFSPIASVVTDEYGQAEIMLGLGSIHIYAVKDGQWAEKLVDTQETNLVILDFSSSLQEKTDFQEDFNFRAPKDSFQNSVQLSEEQKRLKHLIIAQADSRRKEHQKSFYKSAQADKLAAKFSCPQDVTKILKASEGNFEEIHRFLSMDLGEKNTELQLQMLLSLPQKDYTDVREEVLSEHFKSVLLYKKDYPPEIYVPYVLCPRVYHEQLAPYCQLILNRLGKQAAELSQHPKRIWKYISQFQLPAQRKNSKIIGTPAGVLRSGQANEISRKVLFVAICRTLGIPARINSVNLAAQYYENGEFQNAEDIPAELAGSAKLTLLGSGENWSYQHNWSIAVFKNGLYHTLGLTDAPWINGKLELTLSPGSYRLITTTRTPNGNQHAKKHCFSLTDKETKELSISLCETQITDLLVDIKFAPFNVYDENNDPVSIYSVTGEKTAVVIWLEEGCEPTEHILNELIEAQSVLNQIHCNIIFLIRDKSAFDNTTFAKACKAIHSIRVFCADFSETASTIARRMYVNTENLPLTLIVRNKSGIYACSGYNVGIADLLLKIINAG